MCGCGVVAAETLILLVCYVKFEIPCYLCKLLSLIFFLKKIIIIQTYNNNNNVHIYHTMASNGINEYTAGPIMGNTYKMETSLRC